MLHSYNADNAFIENRCSVLITETMFSHTVSMPVFRQEKYCLFLYSSTAEQPTVNRQVPGSNPGGGAESDIPQFVGYAEISTGEYAPMRERKHKRAMRRTTEK